MLNKARKTRVLTTETEQQCGFLPSDRLVVPEGGHTIDGTTRRDSTKLPSSVEFPRLGQTRDGIDQFKPRSTVVCPQAPASDALR